MTRISVIEIFGGCTNGVKLDKYTIKNKINIITKSILEGEFMCGIIGYVGKNNALPIVLNGLKNLEYRGYDSSGIAYLKENKYEIIKSEGKIKNLEAILPNDVSNMAIGHTRWATHGKANTINAHPHHVGKITLVHNGIIENYQEIKTFLEEKGYNFISETDTEIVAGLIDYYYNLDNDLTKTLDRLKREVRGSYALVIMIEGINKLYAIRSKSPLIVGIGESEYYLASDVPAILDYTKKYFLLDEQEICVLDNNGYVVLKENSEIEKEIKEFTADIGSVYKDGYDHFMLKEIHEQPRVVDNLISLILNRDTIDLSKYKTIQIVACGSAYHAGMVGKNLIEKYLGIRTEVYVASEYRYGKIFYDEDTLFIAISQSGETADTLASLMLAKEHGIKTLGIINTVGSSIAREVDEVLYINAGIEMAVATTKAYVLQVLMFSLLVYKSLKENNKLSIEECNKILDELKKLGSYLEEILETNISELTEKLYKKENIFFIGRQIDYALCLEASLKLKEISYIHSEAYAAGELKHGTISLISENTPVIGIVTDKDISEKTISNIKEVKSRGAYVLLIVDSSINISDDIYDDIIRINSVNEFIMPILTIVPLQLLSYNIAKSRGCDIDKPRNLAKSVTVE